MMEHYIVILLISSFGVFAKITIDKVEECDPTADYAIVFTHKIKNENDMQVFEEGGMNAKVDLDDNIMAVVDASLLQGEEWKLLISFKETVCQFIKKYFYNMQEEFEKSAGLTETCPYPKREYKVANVPLDFEKVDYSLVPRGKIRVNASLYDVKTKELLSCEITEITVE